MLARCARDRWWYGRNIPGLANVDHVDAILPGLPEIRLHVHLHVLAADVRLGGEQHLNVLRGGVERRGQVLGGHVCGVGVVGGREGGRETVRLARGRLRSRAAVRWWDNFMSALVISSADAVRVAWRARLDWAAMEMRASLAPPGLTL